MPKSGGMYRSPYWQQNEPGGNVLVKLGEPTC